MDRELGVAGDLVAQQCNRRVDPDVEIQFHPPSSIGSELRVFERIPVDVAVGMVLVAPAQHGQRLVGGRPGVPEVGRLLRPVAAGRCPRTRWSSEYTPRCS